MTKRFLIPSISIITGLFALSVQAQNFGTTEPKEEIVTVAVAPQGGHVILGGTLIPLKEVTMSAQMPGRVESIAGEEGDSFDAGTILLNIDDDDLMARRQSAQAELNNAHTAMRNAQVQYNRELVNPRVYNPRPMAGMGMPSMFDGFFNNMGGDNNWFGNGNKGIERHADLASQSSMVESARAKISQAESGIREVDAALRDTKAIAPFEGVITRKLVEVGDTVQPGQPMMQFAYSKYMRIKVEVPARLMPGLQKGMIVPARLDVGNMQVSARVAQIAPTADSQKHTVTVKFDLPEGIPGRSGMYAEVMIPDVNSPARPLPFIPKAAINRRGSLPSVRIVDENDETTIRLIRIGDEIDDHHVTVLSGLSPGERIKIIRGSNAASN